MYTIVFTKQAKKDAKLLTEAGLEDTAKALIEVIKKNPFENPPQYEKLQGDLKGFFSRRINYQHRLVYQVFKKEKKVKVVSMWSHYEIP